MSRSGQLKEERSVKEVDCSKCRFECNKIPDAVRSEILAEFLEMGDWANKKNVLHR